MGYLSYAASSVSAVALTTVTLYLVFTNSGESFNVGGQSCFFVGSATGLTMERSNILTGVLLAPEGLW